MNSTNTQATAQTGDELKFSPITFEKDIVNRSLRRVRPTASGQTYVGGDIIYMNLPNKEWVSDPHHMFLQFSASCSAAGSTYARFPRFIWNCINQIRFLKDSTEVIPPLRKYGMFKTLNHAFSSDIDAGVAGGILYGDGTQAQRNVWGATPRVYQFPITELFPPNVPILPLLELGASNQWQIEITLEPATVIETDGAPPVFSITQPIFYVETIQPTVEYRNRIRGQIASGNFQLQCMPYKYNPATLVAGSASYTESLPIHVRSLRSMMALMRTSATINTTTTNDRDATYNYNNVNSYQLRLAHELIPQEVVTCSGSGVEPFIEVQRIFDQDDTITTKSHGLINVNNFLNDGFVMGLDLRRSRPHDEKGKYHISGRDTRAQPVQLDIVMSGALGANNLLEQFYTYDCVLKADPTGHLLRIE